MLLRWCASLLIATLLLAAAGCSATPQAAKPAPTASGSASSDDRALISTDPCALRLHDISGALLLYYNTHADLPPTLDILIKSPGAQDLGELTCPASGQPYVYFPAGVPVDPPPSRVVLFDATPAHAGKRLAIVIQPPTQPGGVLQARVIAIPESKAKILRDAAASSRMMSTTKP